jgi:hypothetical protein
MIRVTWRWLGTEYDSPEPHTTDVRLAGRGYVGEMEVRELVAVAATGRREDAQYLAITGVGRTPLDERDGR